MHKFIQLLKNIAIITGLLAGGFVALFILTAMVVIPYKAAVGQDMPMWMFQIILGVLAIIAIAILKTYVDD